MQDIYSKNLKIRMSEKLYKNIQKKASKCDQNISEFCRNVLSEVEVSIPKTKEYLPSKIDEKVALDLTRIGNLFKYAIAKNASNVELAPMIEKFHNLADQIKKSI